MTTEREVRREREMIRCLPWAVGPADSVKKLLPRREK